LRHDAIVGFDNEHNDVGDVRASRAIAVRHACPGVSIKGKCRAIVINAIGADMLITPRQLARRDTCFCELRPLKPCLAWSTVP